MISNVSNYITSIYYMIHMQYNNLIAVAISFFQSNGKGKPSSTSSTGRTYCQHVPRIWSVNVGLCWMSLATRGGWWVKNRGTNGPTKLSKLASCLYRLSVSNIVKSVFFWGSIFLPMQNVSWISWTAGHLPRLVIQSTNSGIAGNVPLSVHPIHRTLLSLHIELVAWGIGLEDFGDLPNVGQHDPDQVLSVQWKIMGGMLPAIFIADKSAATLTTE